MLIRCQKSSSVATPLQLENVMPLEKKKQKGISEVDNDSVELVKNKARINTQNLTNECHCFSVLAC